MEREPFQAMERERSDYRGMVRKNALEGRSENGQRYDFKGEEVGAMS